MAMLILQVNGVIRDVERNSVYLHILLIKGNLIHYVWRKSRITPPSAFVCPSTARLVELVGHIVQRRGRFERILPDRV